MNTNKRFDIGTESVADYLQDMEKRWGIVLVFTIQYDKQAPSDGGLVVELTMPHIEHRREIPWFVARVAFLRAADPGFLTRLMWDMLYAADKEIERLGAIGTEPPSL